MNSLIQQLLWQFVQGDEFALAVLHDYEEEYPNEATSLVAKVHFLAECNWQPTRESLSTLLNQCFFPSVSEPFWDNHFDDLDWLCTPGSLSQHYTTDPMALKFLRNIEANPGQPLPVGIYADWLEEQGDPRAPYVRLAYRLMEVCSDV